MKRLKPTKPHDLEGASMFERIKQDKDRLFQVITFSLIWGVIAHGMGLFNKYSFHDDITYFNDIGRTYTSGRWMLGLMGEAALKLTGSMHYSLPVLKGGITILCLALILYLVFSMLEINDKLMCAAVTGLFIAFPAITGILGYMFTAPYYYSAALIGIIGVYIWNSKRNIPSVIICILLMACAIGTYQSNLTICFSAMTLAFLHDIYRSKASWSDYAKKITGFVVTGIGSVAVYVILSHFFARINGVKLSGYKGIGNLGMVSMGEYVKRILTAYRIFFLAPKGMGNMFPFSARYFHLALVIVCMILAGIMLAGAFRESRLKGFLMTLIFIFFPLAVDLIYIMVEFREVHSLMTYAEVFIFVLAAWLWKNVNISHKAVSLLRKAIVCLSVILLFMIIRFDNICYVKADIVQTQSISYLTGLSTRILSVEEYTPNTPVVYIEEYKKADAGFSDAHRWFETIRVFPYMLNSQINDLKWRQFMEFWCGFNPPVEAPDRFMEYSVVKAMPCYPAHGSIRYIDGCIVVKFADY